MIKNPSRVLLSFDCPATYQINIQGRIDSNWTDRLEGMNITQTRSEAVDQITVLEGNLRDQTALAGVLNTLYGLHLTILSVKRMES